MSKVLVGMSGGVDSSVSALLLKEKGYDVTGVTLLLKGKLIDNPNSSCGLQSDVEDAKTVCQKLGIEHITMDLSDLFAEKVVDDFIKTYISGRTPNPCIECNSFIKFGKMLDKALEMGYDFIATGHYARVEKLDNGRYTIKRPADKSKDQTYVLYRLTQHQLAHTIFPLSDYSKPQIREIAEKAGLINSRKPDSQDICFIPDGDYASFIESYSGYKSEEGNYTDINGNIIGRHKGMIHYTIGQRKGLGVTFGKPMFVRSINAENNEVTLCEEKDLYTSELLANSLNFVSVERIDGKMKINAKTRYSQREEPATVEVSGDIARVVFDKPQRAFTSGQSVVFYDGDTVVGGGKII
ncbi:MAG: tRNA 2-thiouridine(34) synthase MnmA [Oscillospiraceae bacterium]